MYEKLNIPFKLDGEKSYNNDTYYHYVEFLKHLTNIGFTYLGAGGFRSVYSRNNTVIKIPRNGDAVIDNIVEAVAYRKFRNGITNRNIYLAPCRLLPNLSLMMVKVKLDYEREPSWFNNLIDRQYGYHKGRAVCYDYAFEIRERKQIEDDYNIASNRWRSELFNNWRNRLNETPYYY